MTIPTRVSRTCVIASPQYGFFIKLSTSYYLQKVESSLLGKIFKVGFKSIARLNKPVRN